MFTSKETPPRYTASALNKSSFEDVSFTSYLMMKPKDIAKFSQNESGFSINDTEISIFDAHMYFSGIDDPKEVRRQQQKEERSHDLVIDDQRVPSPVSSVDGYCGNFPQSISFNATPAASISEASWNSRTGLLMSNPTGVSLKNAPTNERKSRTFAAKKWLLDRKSNCCIGKKAVQVKEVELESENTVPDSIKTGKNIDDEDNNLPSDFLKNHQQKRLSQENNLETTQETLKQRVSAKGRPFIDELRCFSFPIVSTSNRVNENHVRALKNIGIKSNTSPLEDPPRKSLEVFCAVLDLSSVLGPINPVCGRAGLFDRGSPIVGVTNLDDDIGSDASSDLFEIDSLSAPTSCNSMYCTKDYSVEEHPTFSARRIAISSHGINLTRKIEFDMKSLDEPCSASECDPPAAPSEVSIDWSVATAEGLDKASVTTNISASASEICKADILEPRLQKQEEVGGHGGWRKGNGLLLMGCREEKAVSLGPQPVKRVGQGHRIPLGRGSALAGRL